MGLARRSKRACCSLLLELQGERTAAGGGGGVGSCQQGKLIYSMWLGPPSCLVPSRLA